VLSGSALATPPRHVKAAAHRPPGNPGGGGTDALPFSDNFDSYTAGTGISTNGTWQLWDPTVSGDGGVDATTASSAPNSFKTQVNSDNVQIGNITSGQWRLRAMTYMPSTNGGGTGFVIGVNTFPASAGGNWSMDIQWVPVTGLVSCYDFAGAPTTPI